MNDIDWITYLCFFLLVSARTLAVVPSISRRAVQGVLVRFFRAGDEHHRGVKIAINESELKSWEAFLNYLNRQPKLISSKGAIKHVYSTTGAEIHSINQFQHRQSYVVSSGHFLRTHFRFMSDSFAEETDFNYQQETVPYWNSRAPVHTRWQAPTFIPTEQIYILPYSKLNMYESLLLNRNIVTTFDDWLSDQVTDLLSHYTDHEDITHLFAVTKFSFVEVRSFSKLFHLLKVTDTFIACTDDEYVHARHYLENMKPSDLYIDRVWTRRAVQEVHPRYPVRRGR
jgi:hypothetical protein